jgi:hypothetical protein
MVRELAAEILAVAAEVLTGIELDSGLELPTLRHFLIDCRGSIQGEIL